MFGKTTKKDQDDSAVISSGLVKVWVYMRPHGWMMSGVLLAIASFSAIALLAPILVQRLAKAISTGNLTALGWCSLFVLLFFVGRGLLNFVQNSLVAYVALSVVKRLRDDIFNHMLSLDLNFFSSTRLGDITYRMTEDLDRIGEMIEQFFQQAFPAFITVLFLVSYLFYLNLLLSVVILVAAPVIGFFMSYFGARVLTYASQAQQSVASISAYLAEFITGVKVVKTFAKEPYEGQRFSQLSERYRKRKFSIELIEAAQFPVLGLVQGAALLAIVYTSGYCIHAGTLTIPQFLGYLTAVALLIDPIQMVARTYSNIKQWQASINRIFSIFDIKSKLESKQLATSLLPQSGSVQFDSVSFGYDDRATVLHELSVSIKDKEVIGVVGISGAGKSTLLSLMMRFYDPIHGRVLVGDHDIRHYSLPLLRQQFGVVLQETHLFSGTIADNIAYGDLAPDSDNVFRVARLAHADEFIRQLPQGYDTIVNERGLNLSGGQKQRIAIARALYNKPKILVFDEATSNIDAESEAMIQQSIEDLRGEFTMILVAHRFATIRHADRILVLEQGRVIEDGSHAELMSSPGRYRGLYSKQMFGE